MRQIPRPHQRGLDLDSWRPGQEEAIRQILDAFEHKDTVLLYGPPGSGKSVVAVAVSQMLRAHSLILTATKSLRARYADAPTGLPIVTGRGNHACLWVPSAYASDRPCLFGFRCPERSGSCEYFQQRDAGVAAPIAVVNYALALSAPDGPLLKDRDLLVADEAHLLEDQAADRFVVEIDLEMARFDGLDLPPVPPGIDVASWRQWYETAHPILGEHIQHHEGQVQARNGNIGLPGLRYIRSLVKLTEAGSELRTLDSSWVPVIGRFDRNLRLLIIRFKPLNVGGLLQSRLWGPDTKRLLMSGSVGDPTGLVNALGVGDYQLATMPSAIPASQRPIYYRPASDVTERKVTTAWLTLGQEITHLSPDIRI